MAPMLRTYKNKKKSFDLINILFAENLSKRSKENTHKKWKEKVNLKELERENTVCKLLDNSSSLQVNLNDFESTFDRLLKEGPSNDKHEKCITKTDKLDINNFNKNDSAQLRSSYNSIVLNSNISKSFEIESVIKSLAENTLNISTEISYDCDLSESIWKPHKIVSSTPMVCKRKKRMADDIFPPTMHQKSKEDRDLLEESLRQIAEWDSKPPDFCNENIRRSKRIKEKKKNSSAVPQRELRVNLTRLDFNKLRCVMSPKFRTDNSILEGSSYLSGNKSALLCSQLKTSDQIKLQKRKSKAKSLNKFYESDVSDSESEWNEFVNDSVRSCKPANYSCLSSNDKSSHLWSELSTSSAEVGLKQSVTNVESVNKIYENDVSVIGSKSNMYVNDSLGSFQTSSGAHGISVSLEAFETFASLNSISLNESEEFNKNVDKSDKKNTIGVIEMRVTRSKTRQNRNEKRSYNSIWSDLETSKNKIKKIKPNSNKKDTIGDSSGSISKSSTSYNSSSTESTINSQNHSNNRDIINISSQCSAHTSLLQNYTNISSNSINNATNMSEISQHRKVHRRNYKSFAALRDKKNKISSIASSTPMSKFNEAAFTPSKLIRIDFSDVDKSNCNNLSKIRRNSLPSNIDKTDIMPDDRYVQRRKKITRTRRNTTCDSFTNTTNAYSMQFINSTLNNSNNDEKCIIDLTQEVDSKENDDKSQDFVPPLISNLRKFTLKAGKLWRRSMSLYKKNAAVLASVGDDVFKDDLCSGQKCAEKHIVELSMCRKSVRFVPEDQNPSRMSIFQSYAKSSTLGYVSNTIQGTSTLEKLFEDFSVNGTAARQSTKDPNAATFISTARDLVLLQCGQTEPLPFSQCYPDTILKNCQKIGEGVYGEVFLFRNNKGSTSVMKVIPIEGDLIVNGERQKKFEEILSEVTIAMQLSGLRNNPENSTSGFNEVRSIRCVRGKYPERLLDLWSLYDESRGSENDCPDIFTEEQLYIVLELANGGKDLESFVFNNAMQAYYLFMQTACSLAVAERALQFEHRDLHWGNILISPTERNKKLMYNINGRQIEVPSSGVQVSIIDFTLSRILYDGVSTFSDLGQDPDLFTAEGDYQFEIYRLMQKYNGNEWRHFLPYTNILWLHYVLEKMITALRYKYPLTNVHKTYIGKLKQWKEEILKFQSVEDFVGNFFI